MLADAPPPPGQQEIHPRNLAAPQDHPYVLKRLRETLQETRRKGRPLWDITRSSTPRTHTPLPARKRRGTLTVSTHSTPGAPRATQHHAPDPPASATPPNPATKPATAAKRHADPVQKKPSEPEAKGRQRARQRARLRPTAPNPSPQLSKPPNPPQPPNPSQSLITRRTSNP